MVRMLSVLMLSLLLVVSGEAQPKAEPKKNDPKKTDPKAPAPKKLTDAEMTKLIVGKWRDTFRVGNITIVTTDNFKNDGTLERLDVINGNMNSHSKLKWSIKNGTLTMVLLEGGPVAKGTVLRGKIISMDEENFRLEMEAGADVRKTRVKE